MRNRTLKLHEFSHNLLRYNEYKFRTILDILKYMLAHNFIGVILKLNELSNKNIYYFLKIILENLLCMLT